jgi:hypothetical protein
MISRADRAHSGSTSAVRDRECLVQVEVADIGTDLGGRSQSDLRIHIRAIHVDLSARFVNDSADLAHGFLEYTMRRGIGNHQGAKLIAMFFCTLAQIHHIDIALLITFYGDAAKAGNDRARSVRAVG